MDPLSLLLGASAGACLALLAAAGTLRRRVMRLRAAEARARRQERLAELGALTGGLAHEIKNPLSTIGLNVQLASEAIHDSALPEEERAMLVRRVETVAREAERLAGILNDFLRFAGRIKLAPVETDLRGIVDELVDFYRPQAELHRVILRADLPTSEVRARVDPALVKQALLNLLINATQAIAATPSEAGAQREILMRIGPPAAPANGEALDSPESADPNVAIHVIDTGPGVPPERHAEIFRPYVSGRKGGSGLGLAVTRRIVEEHGGRIDLFSEPGRGSDFVVRLPVSGPTSTQQAEASDDVRKSLLDRLFRGAARD